MTTGASNDTKEPPSHPAKEQGRPLRYQNPVSLPSHTNKTPPLGKPRDHRRAQCRYTTPRSSRSGTTAPAHKPRARTRAASVPNRPAIWAVHPASNSLGQPATSTLRPAAAVSFLIITVEDDHGGRPHITPTTPSHRNCSARLGTLWARVIIAFHKHSLHPKRSVCLVSTVIFTFWVTVSGVSVYE